MIETPWLTTQEAAEYLRITRRVLDQWVKRGEIVRHYPGRIRSPRFHRDHLDALMRPGSPDADETDE